MNGRKTRVLVVDDSALMREFISDVVRQEPDLELAGVANDGRHCLDILEATAPDVITLDIQMPRLDGLATLDAVLATRPVPVIMVSSLTRFGADVTFDALDRGALDYVAKPENGADRNRLAEELPRKIRMVAGANPLRVLELRRQRAERRRTRGALVQKREAALPRAGTSSGKFADKCIVIGISTGGPPALGSMFEAFQPDLPPMVIVQHMPVQFTAAFANRLNNLGPITVKEAATGDELLPNHAYVAQGGKHLVVRAHGSSGKLVVQDGEQVSGHRPSVDVAMKSAAEVFGSRCLGLIMTGMGRDGADGCKAIRAAGGYVLGQDEATSDVYGMNKVAFGEGGVDRQFALPDAVKAMGHAMRRQWGAAAALA